MKHIISFPAFALAAFVLFNAGCKEDALVEPDTVISYEPSQVTATLSTESVTAALECTGPYPYDFVLSVTHDGEEFPVSDDTFSIPESDGDLVICPENLEAKGTYKVSVACTANGKAYRFKDVFTLDIVEDFSQFLEVTGGTEVDYDPSSQEQQAMPKVSVKSEDYKITGYTVAYRGGMNIEPEIAKAYFMLGEDGQLSLNPMPAGTSRIADGQYLISVLGQDADGEELIAKNLIVVNVSVPPIDVKYEESYSFDVTALERIVPVVGAGESGKTIEYTLLTEIDGIVMDENGVFTIDPEIRPGTYDIVVDIKEGEWRSLEIAFSVTITNADYFSYFCFGNNYEELGYTLTDAQKKQAEGISMRVVRQEDLDKPISLVLGDDHDISPALMDRLEWTVGKRLRVKNDAEFDKATRTLTVTLDSKAINDNVRTAFVLLTAKAPNGLEVTIPIFFYSPSTLKDKTCYQTNPPQDDALVEKPYFLGGDVAKDDISVEYIPFVFRVNPANGGTSVSPVIKNHDAANFKIDYRRKFYYYNIDGVYDDDNENLEDNSELKALGKNYTGGDCDFLHDLWVGAYIYGVDVSKAAKVNFGAKAPVSGDNDSKVKNNLIKVDLGSGTITVTGGAWTSVQYTDVTDNDNNKLSNTKIATADGIFGGEMTCINVKDPGYEEIKNVRQKLVLNNGVAIHNFFIWLDKDYEPEN